MRRKNWLDQQKGLLIHLFIWNEVCVNEEEVSPATPALYISEIVGNEGKSE